MNASLVSVGLASSLHILRLWSIQENVRSTTHLRGSTWKPFGGNSFSQSTSTPSFFHCSAHNFRTSSGAGLRARSTRSSVHPQMRKARAQLTNALQERFDPLLVQNFRAMNLGFED